MDVTNTFDLARIINVISGFSLGASSIALFARVGEGIYTKTADVVADLAGKVCEGIPEDDPCNPAVIDDNVGDNVGNVAGMGLEAVILPLLLAVVGILLSIVGAFFVKVKEGGNPQKALNTGEFLTPGLMLIASYFIITNLLPNSWTFEGFNYTSIGIF